MTFPYPLPADGRDRIDYITREDTGWTFWEYVDSRPAYGGPWCSCDLPGVECPIWDHQRGSEWCLAARSNERRCGKRAVKAAPFCDFHFERAWEWMLSAAEESFASRFERVERWAQEEERVVTLRTDLGIAQMWDAKIAAQRIGERVYFFRAGDAVKVGRSIDPEKRVKTLTGTKAPEGLDVRSGTLLGTIPGGCRVEGMLHQRFAYCRLVGEWFDYTEIAGDIAALIEAGTVEVGEVA